MVDVVTSLLWQTRHPPARGGIVSLREAWSAGTAGEPAKPYWWQTRQTVRPSSCGDLAARGVAANAVAGTVLAGAVVRPVSLDGPQAASGAARTAMANSAKRRRMLTLTLSRRCLVVIGSSREEITPRIVACSSAACTGLWPNRDRIPLHFRAASSSQHVLLTDCVRYGILGSRGERMANEKGTVRQDRELGVFNLFIQTARLVEKDADTRMRKAAGISTGQFVALAALGRTRGTMTSGRLAEITGTKPHNITLLVDRMERDGLATTERRPDDRRFVYVQSTKKGRAVLAKAMPVAEQVVATTMAGLTEPDLDTLEGLLKIARRNVAGSEV